MKGSLIDTLRVSATTHQHDFAAIGLLLHCMYLQHVKPTCFMGVPRVWEKLSDQIRLEVGKSTGLKRRFSEWAMVGIDSITLCDRFTDMLSCIVVSNYVFKTTCV